MSTSELRCRGNGSLVFEDQICGGMGVICCVKNRVVSSNGNSAV